MTCTVTVMISDETPIQLFADYPTTEYKKCAVCVWIKPIGFPENMFLFAVFRKTMNFQFSVFKGEIVNFAKMHLIP